MSKTSDKKYILQQITKDKVSDEFLRIVRESNIYRQKPIGSFNDFTKAFKSSKTPYAVRYLMLMSGLMDDPGYVDRAMKVAAGHSNTYGIEPVYSTRKKGVSHFKITAISPGKKVFDVSMSPKVRRLMMGAPIPLQQSSLVGKAMRSSEEIRGLIEKSKALERMRRRQIGITKIDEKGNIEIGSAKMPLDSGFRDISMEDLNNKTIAGQEFRFKNQQDSISTNMEYLHLQVSEREAQRYISDILRWCIQAQKHLEGLKWVLHCFIKLNDHRRLVFDSEGWVVPNCTPTYDEDSRMVNLDLFQGHLEHYMEEQKTQFKPLFNLLNINIDASIMEIRLGNIKAMVDEINHQFFEDFEKAQDEVDEIILEAARTIPTLDRVLDGLRDPFKKLKYKISRAKIDDENYVKFKDKEITGRHTSHNRKVVDWYQSKDLADFEEKVAHTKTRYAKWRVDPGNE